jgi:hypothetical protein
MTLGPHATHRHNPAAPGVPAEPLVGAAAEASLSLDSDEQTLVAEARHLFPLEGAPLDSESLFDAGTGSGKLVVGADAIRFDRKAGGVVPGAAPKPIASAPAPTARRRRRPARWLLAILVCVLALVAGAALRVLVGAPNASLRDAFGDAPLPRSPSGASIPTAPRR